MPVSLTRTVTFHARHQYRVPGWSSERNREQFGTEPDQPAHGHAYQCRVSVTGPVDPATTMIIDLPHLDRILAEEVLVLDGTDLHLAVPEFASGAQQPSCEALAALLYGRIADRLPPGVALTGVRIAEDTTLHADCTGLP